MICYNEPPKLVQNWHWSVPGAFSVVQSSNPVGIFESLRPRWKLCVCLVIIWIVLQWSVKQSVLYDTPLTQWWHQSQTSRFYDIVSNQLHWQNVCNTWVFYVLMPTQHGISSKRHTPEITTHSWTSMTENSNIGWMIIKNRGSQNEAALKKRIHFHFPAVQHKFKRLSW